MNRLLKICFFLSILLFNSCSEFGTNIIIKNNTGKIIDSIIVSNGFNEVMLENLKKNEERKGFIDFKINSPKHDGAYFTKIFTENKIINQKTFGYYSNGIPSGSTYYIQILADSLIVNEYFDK